METLAKLARRLGVSVQWLAFDKGGPTDDVAAEPAAGEKPHLKLVSGFDPEAPEDGAPLPLRDGIPELDLRAGLGPGGLAERHDLVEGNESDLLKDETWRFPRSFVRQELRRPENRLLVIETDGDSMEPTLRSGDRVIVDTDHRVPSPDGLYALRDRFGGTVVKRLQVLRRGDPPVIRVISDNSSHVAEEVGADEIEIVGRVLFGLKKF